MSLVPDRAADAPPVDPRRLLRLFRPYRARLAMLAVLIGISALVGLAAPFLLRGIIDDAIPSGDRVLLALLALGMLASAAALALLGVVQTLISTLIGQRIMRDLRVAVYSHLQRMSLAFFTRTRTGEVQSRIASDIGDMQAIVTSAGTALATNLTVVLASAVAMLAMDWRLALLSFVLVPVAVAISRRVGAARRRIATRRQRQIAAMNSQVQESLSVSGILLGRGMGRSGALVDQFTRASDHLVELEVRVEMTGRWRQSTISIAFAAVPAVTYLVGGLALTGGGSGISVGTLIAFTTLQTAMFGPLNALMRIGVQIQTSLALFARVFEYLDLPIDVVERADPVTIGQVQGTVRYENIAFAYQPGEPILQDVTLEVPAGSTLAIVGATGSGKTTMTYLLARLYDPDQGRVTIDGVDIRDLSFESLARIVGIVSQETYLLNASIAENLRFSRPDASDEDLVAAARAARIHDLIASLPDGYDTVVGERGYRFSGGEKQRIAIARTMLRNAPVLILDEATSALDTATEQAVQAALDHLSAERTTIMVAHRLSTVRHADRIVVLERGRIVESGGHDELLLRGGWYAALVAADRVAPSRDSAVQHVAVVGPEVA
ncbi:ABC transporter ATP-binding protein [Micromonospora sp. NPDC005215]|uniref:ABC transporter ATP-binding protein n=1 Tax=Micromonospora sp. NPDC005215 TaxID=3157024 RepID=UPI0033B46B88